MTQPILATILDLRTSKICAGAARPWFKRHGMDWNLFLTAGLPADDFRATGDPFAIKLADAATVRTMGEKANG